MCEPFYDTLVIIKDIIQDVGHITISAEAMMWVCIELGNVITWLGLSGLIFDLTGATLVVLPEIAWFEEQLVSNEQSNKASRLRRARHELFQEERLRPDDEGFELVEETILENVEMDIDAEIIYAQGPGTFGGGGNVYLCRTEELHEDRESVGAHNLIDGWIQRRVNELESGFRDQYRVLGLKLLVVGFLGQIIASLLQNWTVLRNIILNWAAC